MMMFASPCRRVRGHKAGGTNVSTAPVTDADFAAHLTGSNQLLAGDVALQAGQGVVVSGIADKSVDIGFYAASDDKPVLIKWSKSSGTLQVNSKINGVYGSSVKSKEAPLAVGDKFTVTVTAAVDSVTIDAVNNTTGKTALLTYPVKTDTIQFVRSYGAGTLEPLNPQESEIHHVSWLRTPGICTTAAGVVVKYNALTPTIADEYSCVEWCEKQDGTTGCEWTQKKSRCTAHKSTTVARGLGDSKETICYVPPVKCSCNVETVEEKAWDQIVPEQ